MDTEKYLKHFKSKWKPDFLKRLKPLPKDLQENMKAFLGAESTNFFFFERLEEMSVDEFRGLIPTLAEAFFPTFPDTAARTLEAMLTHYSYPTGYTRRAFRAPNHQLQVQRAADWLRDVWAVVREYPTQDLQWFAVHAGLLGWGSHYLAPLFAQAIDDGDDAVFQILKDTANTNHEIARMGRHVPAAFMASHNTEAHELAEGLLLAAQRQEGLRQVILESVDEASPEAFIRFLDVILREDLLRFAATVRAAGVWFGLGYDVTDKRQVKAVLTEALGYLQHPETAREALNHAAPTSKYNALFCLAMTDAEKAAGLAEGLLDSQSAEDRMAAVQFLKAAEMLDEKYSPRLLADPDLRIGAIIAERANRWETVTHYSFEELRDYAGRLPKAAKYEPLLFPWLGNIPARSDIFDNLIATLHERPLSLLAPHLSEMTSWGKSFVLDRLKYHLLYNFSELSEAERDEIRDMIRWGHEPESTEVKGHLDEASRAMLLELLQDRNSGVSQEAVDVMKLLTPTAEEIAIAQKLLTRKTANLRRGLILLLSKDNTIAQESAVLLLAAKNTEQRQAGLELLELIGGQPPEDFKPKNVNEETLLAKLVAPENQLTLDNGLGLYDPADLTRPMPLQPRERDWAADLSRGAELIQSLDALILANGKQPVARVNVDGEVPHLLMNVYPSWLSWNEKFEIPLQEIWEEWWNNRPDAQEGDATRMTWAVHHLVEEVEEDEEDDDDNEFSKLIEEELKSNEDSDEKDGVESEAAYLRATVHRMFGQPLALQLKKRFMVDHLTSYFLERFGDDTDSEMALDAWETALSYLPLDAKEVTNSKFHWDRIDPRSLLAFLMSQEVSNEQFPRLYNLHLHNNTAFIHLNERLMNTKLLLEADKLGLTSRADLLRDLIGPRPGEGYYRANFSNLSHFTRRKLPEGTVTTPAWAAAVEEARSRVLEVEMERGDLETPATQPALSLSSVWGISLVLRLLAGMGNNPLQRGYAYNNTSKTASFSHLIRVSYPLPDDTAASFKTEVKRLNIPQTRLLDLAMYAPQWSSIVSTAVGWKGLQDGVYWLHAHTKDNQWNVPEEVREAWEGEIAERTPLKAGDLTEGAVDVAWFKKMYKTLGKARFEALLGASKYASSAGGHKRAELFASAILGEISETELLQRITEKRNQDAVRSLGLLPLSRGKKGEKQLESRYMTLAQFRKEAKQWGAQRQASERLAADIGLQNLARTAGYTDPQRLMWAMEARMTPDWQTTFTAEDLTVRIEMDEMGEATLGITRGEKSLKSVPAALKKHPEIVALREAVKALDETRRRMRTALEEATIRGDVFTGGELLNLSQHPVIKPMLENLVWIDENGTLGRYEGGKLVTLEGTIATENGQSLRLAHPHDLFTAGTWRDWQALFISEKRVQPFKQVFREYYLITAQEKNAKRITRYEGHHVQPTKAAALLKTRGWVSVYDEGTRKTFHAEGINVWVDTLLMYGTPNEVEGMPLDGVYFLSRDTGELIPPADVPPRIFSEVMRDLDLVVSVAHVGGVDPEASRSTVEMREYLLHEILRLMELDNVRIDKNHAFIDGKHSAYTVHLGSGVVHRQPGGQLCILPVHNHAAGRIFLPFADPDPRTAEVVSKVVLLAEDEKIQDPTILEQLT